MATNYDRAMRALLGNQRKENDRRLGVAPRSSAPVSNGGAAPYQASNSGGDPVFNALRTIAPPTTNTPIKKPWGADLPIIGDLIEQMHAHDNVGDRVKSAIGWATNDYKPTAIALRALGTTGAATAGVANELVNPDTTPGSNPITAAGRNISNLWSFEPENADPVLYNQDWIKSLREKQTGQDFDEEAPFLAKAGAGVAGFLLDAATDPLSYVGAGTVNRVASGGARATGAGAKAAGMNELAEKATNYANRLKARRNEYGPALRHQQRIKTAQRAPGETIEGYRERRLSTPVVPGTAKARSVMDDAVETVADSKSVMETGSIKPGQDIPRGNKAVRTDAPTTAAEDARLNSVLGDAEPGRLSLQQMNGEAFTQDALSEALDKISPRKPTAVSEAATPRKKRSDAPEIMTPFRSMSRGVGDFAQPSLLDEIPPAENPIEWATTVKPDTVPDLKLYGKKPYSFDTLVRIAQGDYNFGTAATRGSKTTRLTADEISGAKEEATRLITQAHQEATHAARTASTPAFVGRAGAASRGRPGATSQASGGTPSPASTAGGRSTAWEPVTKLGDDWERISARDWKNLQSRLKSLNKKGKISNRELALLTRARRENDPGLWERTIDEIMYEGYPSPVDTALRHETADRAEELLPTEVENVGKNSPTNRLLTDPTNDFAEGKALRKAIEKALTTEFKHKRRTHTVPTKTAAKLTGEGPDPTITGRYHEGFGRFSQYTLTRDIWAALKPQLDEIIRYGPEGKRPGFHKQGAARYELMMPRLEAAFKYLDAQGITVNSSAGIRGLPLNLHDVLASVGKGEAIQMYFHQAKSVPATNLIEAANLIIKNKSASVEDVMSILKQIPGTRGGGANNFAHPPAGNNATQRLRIFRSQHRRPKATMDDMVNYEARLYAQALVNAREKLTRIVSERTARYSAEVLAETGAIAQETIEQALRNLQEGTFITRVNTVEHLDDMARMEGGKIGAKSESIDRAIDTVEDTVAAKVPTDELAHLNGQAALLKTVEEGSDHATFNKVAQKVSDDAEARAQEKAKAGALEDHDAANDLGIAARSDDLYGKFGKSIRKNAGMEELGDAIHTMNAVARPMRAAYRNKLNRVTKRWGRKVDPAKGDNRSLFEAAFDEIRLGRTGANIVNKEVRKAAEEVAELVDFFFPLAADGIDNRFIMRFDNYEMLNAAFARRGYAHVRFDVDAAIKAIGTDNPAAVKRELARQWRDWTITDPEEFLSVAEDVLNTAATNDAIVRRGIFMAQELGAISSKPKPGFVKMPPAPDPKADVQFIGYMPKGTYIDQRILPQFRQMEWFLNQSLNPNGEFGKWVQRNILPVVNMWKTGMTIWNARHWFRNFWGDVSLNYLAGVTDPRAYMRAMRMMRAKSTYNGMWDGAEALRMANPKAMRSRTNWSNPRGNSVIVKSRNGIEFTADDISNYMRDNAAFVSFPVRYDLLDDMVDPSRMQEFTGKFELTGGRAKEIVSSAHEWRDHFVRGAHAIDVIAKGKWRNKAEALQAASELVRKWHPDGSDLQRVESKYLRVFMPFYSWTRRAIPLLAEAMITNPQRVYHYPRAYYNAAEAMGVDLHSMGDPFPVDQMFPEYMTDRITGPIATNEEGEYVGIHPGFIQDDLSQFANDPLGEILGMLSPAIKGPIEMSTGTRIGGADIRDMSDYVDSNIPFINTLSNVTGVSFSGTVGNALTLNRNNQQDDPSVLDRQANVERGLKDHWDMTALTNWLTGLQVTNMSKPNAITRAEFEERDRVEQENRRREMFG